MPAAKLNIRDRILRDTFTIAEQMVFVTILVVALATFLIADPGSNWLRGGLIIGGILTLFILKTHEHTHPFFVDLLWSKFWLVSAPAWLLMLQYLVGLLQSPIASLIIEGESWNTLSQPSNWLPVTSDPAGSSVGFFSFFALYLLATLLFMVPKSRAFFERTFPILCLFSTLLGVFGLLQASSETKQALFTQGTGQSDFFAFFPYDGHWAAFASLWCAACIAMSLRAAYLNSDKYLNSKAPWFLSGASILGFSGLWIEARWPAICLLFCYACLILCVGMHFLRKSKDPDRTLITAGAFIASLSAFLGGISRYLQPDPLAQTSDALARTAITLFKEQPIFGWGLDSFDNLLPFYGQGSLILEHYDRAQSDFFQFAAEFGFVGIVLIVALLVGLIIHYLKQNPKYPPTKYMFFGCLCLLALSLVDTPFYSPAVFFSFWVILFSAIRWTDLNRSEVDQVDARVIVVSDESQRNVPVFEGEHQDKLR